jgi:hypothetical protein
VTDAYLTEQVSGERSRMLAPDSRTDTGEHGTLLAGVPDGL